MGAGRSYLGGFHLWGLQSPHPTPPHLPLTQARQGSPISEVINHLTPPYPPHTQARQGGGRVSAEAFQQLDLLESDYQICSHRLQAVNPAGWEGRQEVCMETLEWVDLELTIAR